MGKKKTAVAAAAAALPDDLLAVVLGRLPARSLAASRGVCKAWRDLIDEHHLLLRFLLPHSVRGLFFSYQDYNRSHFLSRPTSPEHFVPRRIDGKFDFIEGADPHGWYEYRVVDHCNGLVLFTESHGDEVLRVCNPTTRWSARLPPCPAGAGAGAGAAFDYTAWNWGCRAFLVFDPFVSPEYKVLLSPAEPRREQMEKDDTCRRMEWPPSAWQSWHEFSSATGRWEEEKVLVREGEAAGTAGDLLLYQNEGSHVEPPCRYAAYWKGALYIHWRGEFLSRLSLLDDKYRVIKSPIEVAECKNGDVRTFLGRSEKGVYIAAIAENSLAILRVWTLSESSDQMEWVPKHQINLQINTQLWSKSNEFDKLKCWTVDHEPLYRMLNLDDGTKNQDVSLEQNVCWNSDDDDNIIVDNSDDDQHEVFPYVKFLGFHPYKEIIFLSRENCAAVAFHLNSPKVQYLGKVHLAGTYNQGIRESFVYTPCLIGDY